MKIEELKKKYPVNTLRKMVVCDFIKDDKILLGLKKVRFGEGNIIGFGGKLEGGETYEEALIRECQEEVGLKPIEFQKMAVIVYYFPHKPEWNGLLHAYICTKWEGDPIETEEMLPIWFDKDKIPFDRMWDDNKLWIPKVLNGESVEMVIVFNEDLKVKESKLIKI